MPLLLKSYSLESLPAFNEAGCSMQAKICATAMAQLCQRTGTTVPPQWHKSILANAESFRCILADPAYASFIINFLIDDFKLQWNIL